MTRSGHSAQMSIKDADAHVMGEINHFLDAVMSSSQVYDMELQKHCIKFQLEQASSKAAYQRRSHSPLNNSSPDVSEPRSSSSAALADKSEGMLMSPEMEHLKQTLKRMLDLGSSVAAHVLKVTTQLTTSSGGQSPLSAASFGSGQLEGGRRQASPSPGGSPPFASPDSTGMASFRASSVEDVSMDETWMECGAHLMHCSVEIMGLVLIVHDGLRRELQSYLVAHLNILQYVHDALSITKEHETTYYAAGYRTNVMKLIANVSYENEETSALICRGQGSDETTSPSLLHFILCATKIDDENPHLVEWAEFAIRNIMSCSGVAREEMTRLRAVGVDEGTRMLLKNSKVEHVLNVETGKLSTKQAQ